jgi:hypothetical protein
VVNFRCQRQGNSRRQGDNGAPLRNAHRHADELHELRQDRGVPRSGLAGRKLCIEWQLKAGAGTYRRERDEILFKNAYEIQYLLFHIMNNPKFVSWELAARAESADKST